MGELIYRCPECGGLLQSNIIEPNLSVKQCEGCTALYEHVDPALRPYTFLV